MKSDSDEFLRNESRCSIKVLIYPGNGTFISIYSRQTIIDSLTQFFLSLRTG